MPEKAKMSPLELRGSASLALIFFLRMFGLFLILPVFALYARDLEGSTPTLIGIGLGIYGLTQASLQIPFGMLSDKLGRKPVILTGLILFIAGSLIAGFSDNIYVTIIGRALQGAGAVASAIMALAADLTREQHRTKAMAMIGMSVGLAFSLSFVVGPALVGSLKLSGLFFVTATLALISIIVLFTLVPTPDLSEVHGETTVNLGLLKTVLTDYRLLGFDLGIFVLHMILMANFVVIPAVLYDTLGIASSQHWLVYLPVLLLSLFMIVPFIIMADRKKLTNVFYTGAICLLLLAELLLAMFSQYKWPVFIFLTLFFVAFNYLEASLPSLISKSVQANRKGTALGIYSTSQFLGTFLGGLSGGILYQHFQAMGVFLLCAFAALIWLFFNYLINKKLQKYV